MPKPSSRKRAAEAEEYDSDGGFVEDAPKNKKPKKPDDKSSVSNDVQTDDDGNEFWELSGKRRIHLSEFKGNMMIGIREFYEAGGKTLPGKKGISLPIEQFSTLVRILPEIEKSLKARGIQIPRPQYNLTGSGTTGIDEDQSNPNDDADIYDGDDVLPTPASRSSKKPEQPRTKQNHEATSDEDED